jgi:hypothetical protein
MSSLFQKTDHGIQAMMAIVFFLALPSSALFLVSVQAAFCLHESHSNTHIRRLEDMMTNTQELARVWRLVRNQQASVESSFRSDALLYRLLECFEC